MAMQHTSTARTARRTETDMAQFIVTTNAQTVAYRHVSRAGAMAMAVTNGGTSADVVTIVADGARDGADVVPYRLADGTLNPAATIARHRATFGTLAARWPQSWRRYNTAETARFAAGTLNRADLEMVASEIAWRAIQNDPAIRARANRADVIADVIARDNAENRVIGR